MVIAALIMLIYGVSFVEQQEISQLKVAQQSWLLLEVMRARSGVPPTLVAAERLVLEKWIHCSREPG